MQFNTATAKLLAKGFDVQWISAANVREDDVTLEKIGIFLQIVKTGKLPLDWEQGESD